MPAQGYSLILSPSRCTGISVTPVVITIEHSHFRYGGRVLKKQILVWQEKNVYCILNYVTCLTITLILAFRFFLKNQNIQTLLNLHISYSFLNEHFTPFQANFSGSWSFLGLILKIVNILGLLLYLLSDNLDVLGYPGCCIV